MLTNVRYLGCRLAELFEFSRVWAMPMVDSFASGIHWVTVVGPGVLWSHADGWSAVDNIADIAYTLSGMGVGVLEASSEVGEYVPVSESDVYFVW